MRHIRLNRALIASREVNLAGALNFTMVALRFVSVTREGINVMEENSIVMSTNDATTFGVTLSKRKL